jgi:hypothetical protein
MDIRVQDAKDVLQGMDTRIEDTEVVLVISYPLAVVAKFKIKSKTGFTMIQLVKHICRAYKKIYNNDEKYGIWGHDIGDLVVEGVRIRRRKGVTYVIPDVGS